jgi:hypothetical protein
MFQDLAGWGSSISASLGMAANLTWRDQEFEAALIKEVEWTRST